MLKVVDGPFAMTTQQNLPPLHRGIVKQVLSGDSVIIRASQGAPPPEKQLIFSGVTAPKLGRRATDGSDETKDEPWAWEAREFLRKKLIGEEVLFRCEKPPNATREYGVVYLGKDLNTAENITESLVSEGFVTVRRTQDNSRLSELEDAAKTAGKGKWGGNNSEHVRDIKWSVDNMRTFIDKQAGKPVKAIIEHVRDGSTVRAFLLPDFNHVTLMISGIRCPGFKLDDKGKPDPNTEVPFAKEARYFVEVRLLQRDVEIVLESVNNNNFVGTILYPKGNIAELLLKEGLARCVDWSIAFMKSGADKLRAAERQAKEGKRKMWKDWQSSSPQLTGKEKEFTATVVEVVNGDALMVKLANNQVKKMFLSSIRPPKEVGRAADEDGKPTPRPKGFRPLYDIPWMFEAREFLRKKLIDKKVHVVIDYIQEARDSFPEKTCATVTIGGVNVAEALVLKGYATVVRYRPDDDQRSSHYDDLLSAETKAIKSQKGIHAKKDIPSHRIIEIDAVKSKQYFSSFQRAERINGIVEFVASGSRMRVFIPKEHCLCTFLLGGINCPRGARPAMGNQPPSEAEPFGEEALAFTKEKCLQKEVTVQVESTDKAGNFIGWLWIDNTNLSVALVQEGLASMHPTADRSKYSRELKNAEDSAKQRKLKKWKDYVEEKEEEEKVEEERTNPDRKVSYEEVVITEITKEGTFFAQNYNLGAKAEALTTKLRQEFQANPPLPGAYTPKRGDICAAKYTVDEEWYRAKVDKVTGSSVTVLYIDYGNMETLNSTRLASIPANCASEKPYATEYSLACVSLPKDVEYADLALKYMREDTMGRKLLLNVEYRVPGVPPCVTLMTEGQEEDIAKNLITDGLLLVEKRRERRLNKLMNEYRAAQDAAKKNHSNIWEYGDITEDDANEFGTR
ncbi:PREDICTED: staphylococcal nuclease domain-containing protein 1 [Nicrophorus vespilloides]|uniref:Staphylococcal nuclease domain-containing protein 1 n=1 Tax=Nicrophorus vespilloides TaxID=110193 RepID=A0ABM1MAV2_NICVS|nr:PREDICTED: staphylococcal nuclease domain-containing protein 1 [Nicrophorus vespilloides]